jgi:hypothetical protein
LIANKRTGAGSIEERADHATPVCRNLFEAATRETYMRASMAGVKGDAATPQIV